MINQPTAKARLIGRTLPSSQILFAFLVIILLQACSKHDAVTFFKVVHDSPSNGQYNIDPEASVSVTFNSPIDTASMKSSFQMISKDGQVPGIFNFKDSGFEFI